MKTILRVIATLILVKNLLFIFIGYTWRIGFTGGLSEPPMTSHEAYSYVILALGICASLLVLKFYRIGIILAIVIYFISGIFLTDPPIWLNGIYLVGCFAAVKHLMNERKLTKQN